MAIGKEDVVGFSISATGTHGWTFRDRYYSEGEDWGRRLATALAGSRLSPTSRAALQVISRQLGGPNPMGVEANRMQQLAASGNRVTVNVGGDVAPFSRQLLVGGAHPTDQIGSFLRDLGSVRTSFTTGAQYGIGQRVVQAIWMITYTYIMMLVNDRAHGPSFNECNSNNQHTLEITVDL